MKMDKAAKRWPGQVDDAHPELFVKIPPQPSVLKPGQLTPEQVCKYYDEGYLLIESFFTPEELQPGIEAINQLVDEIANKLFKAGKIKDRYSDHGFKDRLTLIENEFPGANIVLHKLGKLPQPLRDIWCNERLLNIVEQLLGTADIVGHPVWNLRTKTPNNEATIVPWHQDSAYFDNNSYRVFQLGAWIPLINARAETGCMQVARYGHKTGKIATHQCCYGPTWYVMMEEEEIQNTLGCDLEKDIITCPVPFGGLLLFNNFLPHKSIPNVSDKIRWSLDLRWQAAGKDIGFWGLKEGVRMRSSTDPNLKIDWEPFDAINRTQVQNASLNKEEDEFDTTISGPWMMKWELANLNKHTAALAANENRQPTVLVG